ncbi:transposase [Candidatus Paracaedibacter symbiosus]|uniref:transposase n=1 Tax=Candidatus Paracaedibacter symbiosus TaxID=244582 RepID=UPI0018DC83AC|nr:transposase [Candidatus Paracaedibacter symbiosus]
MGEKKIQGRKRHIGVDVLGCLLSVHCHAANFPDTKRAALVMDRLIDKYPSIQAFAGDGGYRGTALDCAVTQLNRAFHIAVGLTGKYVPMSMRWVVDRTLGWITKARRLVRDYEVIPGNAENMVRISMLKIMLAKLV